MIIQHIIEKGGKTFVYAPGAPDDEYPWLDVERGTFIGKGHMSADGCETWVLVKLPAVRREDDNWVVAGPRTFSDTEKDEEIADEANRFRAAFAAREAVLRHRAAEKAKRPLADDVHSLVNSLTGVVDWVDNKALERVVAALRDGRFSAAGLE